MSNQGSINISSSNVTGNCHLKCSYNYYYSDSSLTVTNSGVLIGFPYDNGNTSPVIYNQQKYTVKTVQILCPSLNIYNGQQAAGEIIVIHNSQQGGNYLNVCVPFIASTSSTTATNLLTQLITDVSTSAPTEGENVNINMNGFTLQNIIPKKPYYNFASTSPNIPGDFIVFDISNAIPINQQTLTTLGNIIEPFNLQISGDSLFYNSKGPTTSASGVEDDGIYISCQPTGASEEQVSVTMNNPITNDLSDILKTPGLLLALEIIICCILFIIIFYILNLVINFITGSNVKIPSFMQNSSQNQ